MKNKLLKRWRDEIRKELIVVRYDYEKKDGSVMKGYIVAQKMDGLWCNVSYGPHLDKTMGVYRYKMNKRLALKVAGYKMYHKRRRLWR